MSATFDATTTSEYSAATTAAARSALIVAALTGTISVKVFDGTNTEMGSGTMDSPWATASGDTVTVGEVTSFTVGTTATPDADWYIRFQNAGVTRWVRGSFGLSSSSQDFTWSLATWTATHTGTIGTATITTSGNAAPAFTVAPTTANIAAAGGTIQFTAVDPDGDPVVYSLTTTRFGITIDSSTGLVTVTSAAAATSGNIVVQASDGTLTASATCSVTVQAVGDSETLDYSDPIFGVALSGGRTTINVTSTATLQAAIDGATSGTTIQLGAGTYAGAVTVNRTFDATDALIIKGASNFTSIATGTWTMTGARQIVTGVQLSGAGKVIVNGTNNHFIGNKISDWTSSKAIVCGSSTTGVSQCEVAYNEIGPYAGALADHWSIKSDTTSASNTVPLDVWIHHNYIYGHKATSFDNDYAEPGNSGHSWALTLNAGWYWQENLFGVHADSNKNAVDMKFSGTTFLRNTITTNGALKLTARIGGSMIFDGNYLGSNGQILINGPDNIVVANNGTIKVQAGEPGVFTDRPVPHLTSSDTLVAKNIGTLYVGNQPNSAYTVAASGTTIEEHTGSIITGLATGTVDHSGQASSYVCTPAVQLTTSDVGPSAITNASAAYKAARGLS
jgi:hypothetical protein